MNLRPLFAVIALGACALTLSSRSAAQDISVTPLAWVDPIDAPSELPVARHALDPDFPDDLRHPTEPGYVILWIFTDEKGQRLSLRTLPTLAAYERVVRSEAINWKLKPGLRAGQPVNSYTTCTVIFNPASADRRRPDATPRILAVKEVVVPSHRHIAEEVVWGTVSVDASGRPTALTGVSDELTEPCREALKSWAFAPARQGGHAIAGELRVPFIVICPDKEKPSDIVPPRVLKRVKPEYPPELRSGGLRGEVVVNFVVDREGRVTKAYVVRSLNPAFDEPALDAIRQWKYEPGRRSGVPQPAHMQVSMMFSLERKYEGGDAGLIVKKQWHQDELPPEYQYDVPPKPRGRVVPVYPYELLSADVTGKARVRFAVGPEGKVIFAEIGTADRPEFGAALQAVIDCFEFEPALKEGRPNGALLNMEQRFSRYDDDGVFTRQDREILALEKKHPERIVGVSKLDAKLHPISQRPPLFPLALNGAVDKGEAVVEVLVDDEGRARLPRVFSASAPAFGWAAVQAVSAWQFDPPMSGGKPVVTRVRIPFRFTGPAPEPKAH